MPKLQKLLVEHGIMLSFFNEFDMAVEESWVKAVQYFGTKGFFAGYNAEPDRKLSGYEAVIWLKNFRLILSGKEDGANFARLIKRQPEKESARLITVADFINNLENVSSGKESVKQAAEKIRLNPSGQISRKDACHLLYRLLN